MAIILRQNTATNTGKGTKLTFAEMDSNLESFFHSSSLSGNILTLFTTGSVSHSINLGGIAPNINTGSLLLTASYSNQVITFTKADNSTFALNLGDVVVELESGSLLKSSSFAEGVITFEKGNGSTYQINLNSLSGSSITTGSYSNQVITLQKGNGSTFALDLSEFITQAESGSLLASGSYNSGTNVITFTKGDGTTFSMNLTSNSDAKIAVTNTSTDQNYYLTFVEGTSGEQDLRVDNSAIVYNPSSNTLQTENLVLTGDLTVQGTRTELQVTDLRVEDKLITVASGSVNSAAADGAGIEVAGANQSITWDHANSRFKTSTNLGVTGTLNVSTFTTDEALTDFVVIAGDGTLKKRTSGAQGTQGTQGIQGTQGTQGTQGVQGVQGTTGTATQGTQGIQGITGTQGTQGIQGTTGTATQGTQGIQGTTGTATQGIQGITGTQGIQGTTGTATQGIQGTQGTTGTATQGIQGITGTQGTQGTTGTATQGIQGTQGTTGDASTVPGPQGVQGVQGIAGGAAAQGIQGIQGTTGTATQGIQGITGAQGITGTQGTDGSQGIQGITGTQGIQGTTGTATQGIQGIQGTTGSATQGIQGITGTQGTQGTTGSATQGIQGITGTQGTQGTAGADGTNGTNGAQGTQGIQGATGTGTQGVSGAEAVTLYNSNSDLIDTRVVNHNGYNLTFQTYNNEQFIIDAADGEGLDLTDIRFKYLPATGSTLTKVVAYDNTTGKLYQQNAATAGSQGTQGVQGPSGAGAGLTLSNNTNNYVITATGTSDLNGEANLTFTPSTGFGTQNWLDVNSGGVSYGQGRVYEGYFDVNCTYFATTTALTIPRDTYNAIFIDYTYYDPADLTPMRTSNFVSHWNSSTITYTNHGTIDIGTIAVDTNNWNILRSSISSTNVIVTMFNSLTSGGMRLRGRYRLFTKYTEA